VIAAADIVPEQRPHGWIPHTTPLAIQSERPLANTLCVTCQMSKYGTLYLVSDQKYECKQALRHLAKYAYPTLSRSTSVVSCRVCTREIFIVSD